jgi:hypothetical protein
MADDSSTSSGEYPGLPVRARKRSDPLAEARPRTERAAVRQDALQREVPPLLRLYYEGELDLEQALASRYPALPLMSLATFATYGGSYAAGLAHGRLAVATLAAQDGAASLRIEVDTASKQASFTFTLNSMLSLTFTPSRLMDTDRRHWLERMRVFDPDITFLWSAARWDTDYLICAPRKVFTTVYAFSARAEAAARLTNEVAARTVEWLAGVWQL